MKYSPALVIVERWDGEMVCIRKTAKMFPDEKSARKLYGDSFIRLVEEEGVEVEIDGER